MKILKKMNRGKRWNEIAKFKNHLETHQNQKINFVNVFAWQKYTHQYTE